jgi:hypothetical protein
LIPLRGTIDTVCNRGHFRVNQSARRHSPPHRRDQAALDLVPAGDFAFYDQMPNMSFALGNPPARMRGCHGDALDNFFRLTRGRAAAGEMTK